jgi:outer membrane protein assembly factor BamB
MFAFDRQTGKQLWEREAGGRSSGNEHHTPLPTPDGKHVLVPSGDGLLMVFDATTGVLQRRPANPHGKPLIGAAALGPDHTKAYVMDKYGRYSVLDLGDWTLKAIPVNTVAEAGKGFVLSPDGKWAFNGFTNNFNSQAVKLTP